MCIRDRGGIAFAPESRFACTSDTEREDVVAYLRGRANVKLLSCWPSESRAWGINRVAKPLPRLRRTQHNQREDYAEKFDNCPRRGATAFSLQPQGPVFLTASPSVPFAVSATLRGFLCQAPSLRFEERFYGCPSSTPRLRPDPRFSLRILSFLLLTGVVC